MPLHDDTRKLHDSPLHFLRGEIRMLMYASCVLAYVLLVAQAAMTWVGPTHGALVLLVLLYLGNAISMYTGVRHSELVRHDDPIDPNTSVGFIGLVVIGSILLQFASSWWQVEIFGLPPDTERLNVTEANFATTFFVVGLLFPVGEEIFFRHFMWEGWKQSMNWMRWEGWDEKWDKSWRFLQWLRPVHRVVTQRVLEPVQGLTAPVILSNAGRIVGITLLFSFAHIWTWGFITCLTLIPVSLFYTLIRSRTGGPLTGAIGHVVFNTTTLVYVLVMT